MTRKTRVLLVDDDQLLRRLVSQQLSVMGFEVMTAASGGEPCVLGAHVRAYTYFAIPYSDVRTRCDRGVIEYHVFRPRTRVE